MSAIKNIAKALKERAWIVAKKMQKRLSESRIPPPLLSPLVRLFADNHKWKTKYIEPQYSNISNTPGYFECICSECHMVRQTYILGDPMPRYFEKSYIGNLSSLKAIEFSRCEDFKFRKLLK